MKYRICTLVVLAAAWLPVRAVENLSTLLPEDVTVFSSAKDGHLFEHLDEHPLKKILVGSGLEKVLAPWLAKTAENKVKIDKIYKEETGLSMDEVMKKFGGATAVGAKIDFAALFMGVANLRGNGAAELPKGFLDATVAMDFSGDEALAEKIVRCYGRMFGELVKLPAAGASPLPFAKFPDEYEATAEDYAGVKLHVWKLKKGAKSFIESPGYALIDGAMVVSFGEEGLRASVDRVKKGGKSLAESPRHAALAKSAKDSDMVSYFDIGSVVKSGMNAAAKQGGAGAGQGLSVVRALGLHKLDFIYFTLDLSKNRSDMEFGVTYHDNPGIMKIFATDGPGIVPNFLPPDADSGGHSTIYFDKMLAAIEGLMKEAVPAMGDMIGAQIDELKKQTGVDIRKDIIANIGPDFISASEPLKEGATKKDDDDEEMEPTIVGIKIKDRKTVELAVNTLINKSAPDGALFEKREYQGVSINNMKDAPMGYIFTDDWFIMSMGPQTLLEKVITRLAKPGDDHLFAQPIVKSAFEGLPGDDDGSTFLDLGPTLDKLLEMASGLGEVPGLSELINLKDLPKKLNLPIVIGMRQYKDDNSFHIRMHIAEKKK